MLSFSSYPLVYNQALLERIGLQTLQQGIMLYVDIIIVYSYYI